MRSFQIDIGTPALNTSLRRHVFFIFSAKKMSRVDKKKRRKISNRNRKRLFNESHTRTKKNNWFHEHRKLEKEIMKKEKKIERLKR